MASKPLGYSCQFVSLRGWFCESNMKRQTKLTSQEQQELSEAKSQQTTAREFATPEELLRYDTKQTIVPSAVSERLAQSIQQVPKPPRSWWQRLFRTPNP